MYHTSLYKIVWQKALIYPYQKQPDKKLLQNTTSTIISYLWICSDFVAATVARVRISLLVAAHTETQPVFLHVK